jgi:hypothetical protein
MAAVRSALLNLYLSFLSIKSNLPVSAIFKALSLEILPLMNQMMRPVTNQLD